MGGVLIAAPVDKARRDMRAVLEAHGYKVTETAIAAESLALASGGDFDLVALDCRIHADLYGFCRTVRSQSALGMIVIVPDGSEQTRIDALNAGADDYVTDQCISSELPARVRAVLRRIPQSTARERQIALPDRVIDFRSHQVRGRRGDALHLTPKECSVLEYLSGRPGEVVSNRELSQAVWRREEAGDFEYVRTVIGQIRKKIEPDFRRPQFLFTERPVGYRFLPPPEFRQIRA